MKVCFDEIAIDFIRDEGGILWFIGVKAFILNDFSGIPNLRFFANNQDSMMTSISYLNNSSLIKHSKITNDSPCGFCHIEYSSDCLQNKLTSQMIDQAKNELKVF